MTQDLAAHLQRLICFVEGVFGVIYRLPRSRSWGSSARLVILPLLACRDPRFMSMSNFKLTCCMKLQDMVKLSPAAYDPLLCVRPCAAYMLLGNNLNQDFKQGRAPTILSDTVGCLLNRFAVTVFRHPPSRPSASAVGWLA